jgi:CCR4-NOT transcription complex subunit 6
MKKQKATGTKKRNKKKAVSSGRQCASWVDEHLDWISEDSFSETNSTAKDADSFSIVSWNVLADSYCSYRSHQHLPMKYQRHVFDRPQRQHRVRQILKRFATDLEVDILALQEVDAPLEVPKHMTELGYSGVQTPTCPAGRNGRVDSCVCYYRNEDWRCLQEKILRLDDLSTLCSKRDKTGLSSIMASSSNLRDVQSTFVRKNVALLVKLENKHNNRKIVVAVMHLYWNPNYDYVKVRPD